MKITVKYQEKSSATKTTSGTSWSNISSESSLSTFSRNATLTVPANPGAEITISGNTWWTKVNFTLQGELEEISRDRSTIRVRIKTPVSASSPSGNPTQEVSRVTLKFFGGAEAIVILKTN